MSEIIKCLTNPNCEMIEECESKIDCTVAMEASEGLTRYICGITPCKYSNKSNCNTTNCNLTTCRYNENGKCTNEEKRKECVEVAKNVLLVGSYDIYGCDTYSVNIKPTIEPLNTVKVSVLYNGTKETKWIDCIYTTHIKLEPKKTIYGLFSYNGNKISEKRILKWKYR